MYSMCLGVCVSAVVTCRICSCVLQSPVALGQLILLLSPLTEVFDSDHSCGNTNMKYDKYYLMYLINQSGGKIKKKTVVSTNIYNITRLHVGKHCCQTIWLSRR